MAVTEEFFECGPKFFDGQPWVNLLWLSLDEYGQTPRQFPQRGLVRAEGGGLCRTCRNPSVVAPTDAERTWWLARFDDEEVALMSSALFGVGDASCVAAWRCRLGAS